jgi:tRNA(fMet)-specific endonuclease VapC
MQSTRRVRVGPRKSVPGRKRPLPASRRWSPRARGSRSDSRIVASELRFGAAKIRSKRLTAQLEAVLFVLEILPLEEPADRRCGELRVHLERQGTPIGPNDMLIAAHALAVGLTVVTDSVRVFSRVPGLHVENWLAPLRLHAGSPIAASRGPSLSVHHSGRSLPAQRKQPRRVVRHAQRPSFHEPAYPRVSKVRSTHLTQAQGSVGCAPRSDGRAVTGGSSSVCRFGTTET